MIVGGLFAACSGGADSVQGPSEGWEPTEAFEITEPPEDDVPVVEEPIARPDEPVVTPEVPECPGGRVGADGECVEVCLDLNVDQLDFGPVRLGSVRSEQLVMKNCSRSEPLLIEAIDLEGDGELKFAAWSFAQTPFELAPGDDAFIDVEFSADVPGDRRGEIAFGVGLERPRKVSWSGQVVVPDDSNECAIATAQAILDGSPLPPAKTLDLGSPGRILLFGDESIDPDGEVSRYRWSLYRRPFDSEASIEDRDKATASILVDVPGSYIIKLSVFDDQGLEGCRPADIIVEVLDGDVGE